MPGDRELGSNPFGTGQSWMEVKTYIGRILRGKFDSLRRDPSRLEDILSDVMLDLLDYWSTLASSKLDSGYYSWRKAVNRGVKFGSRAMWDSIRQRDTEYASLSSTPTNVFDNSDEAPGYTPAVESAEDEYLDVSNEEVAIARKVLQSFSHAELREFFEGILGDRPARESAAIYGVSHTTVLRRRRAQKEKLMERAKEMGLVDV